MHHSDGGSTGSRGRPERVPSFRRRRILAAAAGMTTAATIPTTQATAATTSNGPATAATDLPTQAPAHSAAVETWSQSITEQQVTLSGGIQTAPVQLGNRLLVGTTRGVYIFSEQSLSSFVPVRSVRSLHPVSDELVVALVEDRFFPNVVGIDPEPGEVRWSASQSVSVYNQELGVVERQTIPYDAVGIGGDDVAVAAGYGIFALDGQTGERRWSVELDRYVWRVAYADGTIYASTQRGELRALDAETGEAIFTTQLVEPYSTGSTEITRSVWDVTVAPDGVVVTTEAGDIVQVDPEDGSVDWERSLLDLDDDALDRYYNDTDGRPSMPAGQHRQRDGNFFNLELTPIDGGANGYVVTVFEYVPGGESQLRLTLVGPGGDQQWENESAPLVGANVVYHPEYDDESVLIPQRQGRDEQGITRVVLSDGSENEFSVPTVDTADRIGGRRIRNNVASLGASGDSLAVVSASGDLQVVDGSGELVWGFPSVRGHTVHSGNFLNNGTEDYLIASQELIDRSRGPESRTLICRSGSDGSIEWSRTVGLSEFRQDGGFRQVRTVERSDSTDLVALREPLDGQDDEIRQLENDLREIDRDLDVLQRERERLIERDADEAEIAEIEQRIDDREADREELLAEIEASGGRGVPEVVVLSGRDGTARASTELRIPQDGPDLFLDPTSLDTITVENQLFGLVATTEGLVFVDLDAGGVVDILPFNEVEALPPFDRPDLRYRTIGSDSGPSDLLAIDGSQARVAVLETSFIGDQFQITGTEVIDLPGDNLQEEPTLLGDLTDDGRQEFTVLTNVEEGVARGIVSPGSGQIIRYDGESGIVPTVKQIPSPTGEGLGLSTFHLDGDEFIVEVFDGLDSYWRHEQELSSRAFAFDTMHHPVAPAGDIDDDGTDEMAVVVGGPEGGSRVELYDPVSGDLIETIGLEPFDDDVDPDEDSLVPGIDAELIEGGSDPKLGVVIDPTFGGPEPTFYVLDPATATKQVSGHSDGATFLTFDSTVGVLGSDTSLTTFDPNDGVALAEPTGGSDQQLDWTFSDDATYVSTVRVNQRPVTITTDQSATVRLPDGTHHIEVGSRNREGLTFYDSETVTVADGSVAELLLSAGAAMSVLILFAIGAIDGFKRRLDR